MAKLGSASVRLVQKMNRKNQFDEFPIYIVVCWKGRVEKACGISCKEKYWDKKREMVKPQCPNSPVLNKMLNDIKQRVIDRKNEFEYNGRAYTARMLLEECKVDLDGSKNVFKGLMMRLIDERRLAAGTIRSYDHTYKKLCEFLNRKDFIVDELTLGVVKDFSSWLERNDIKINTIKRILSCVAAVWNYGIQKKVANAEGYPFGEFKYTQKYKECPRDYFLEKSHIVRLKEYWLNMVIERHGKRWTYKDGMLEKLQNRNSAEFGILWFLMCYKMNGSSPADVALIRPQDCKRITINGEDYWAVDIRRKKTGRDVHIRMKRDMFIIIAFEHFMGFASHFVYPILHYHEGCTDKYLLEQSHKVSDKAIKAVRKAFLSINEKIAHDNANGGSEPTVEVNRVVMYSARHSFANNYLTTSKANVSGLASLMARSPNTIATYVHQLTNNEQIAEMVEDMPI